MNMLPQDLVPLPTQPWDERPDEIPLDIEESRTALWLSRGNITEAAKRLRVSSERFRRHVKNSRRLQDVVEEAKEQLKDIAESNVYDALTDADDAQRRDGMTKFVLTNLANDRGFGNSKGININPGNTPKGRLMVVWDDGEDVTDNQEHLNTIEGETVG